MDASILRMPYRTLVHSALGAALFLQLCCGVIAQQPTPADEGLVATFKVEKHGELLLLPVTIDGITGPFVLDSGASHHVLDQQFTARLGEPIRTQQANTASNPAVVKVFNPPRMLVGELVSKHNRPVVTMDLTRASEVLGKEIFGILGVPFLLNHVVSIDFDRGSVRVFEVGTSPEESWGIAVPVDVDVSGRAYLRGVVIGEEKLTFLIDTGMNSSVSLAKNDIQHIESAGQIASPRTSLSYTLGGKAHQKAGSLRSLKIGPFEHALISFHESRSSRIGLGYLSRYRVTFDLSRRQIYLARGAAYSAADTEDKSGLHISWTDKRIVVDLVDKGSPAQHAGIIKGDVVLSVNGIPATGNDLSRLRRSFKADDKQVQRLTLLRGEQELKVSFSLQDHTNWMPLDGTPSRQPMSR